MERRFKYGEMRDCTAVYGCETTGLLTGAQSSGTVRL